LRSDIRRFSIRVCLRAIATSGATTFHNNRPTWQTRMSKVGTPLTAHFFNAMF
jgi:hypothetical protein